MSGNAQADLRVFAPGFARTLALAVLIGLSLAACSTSAVTTPGTGNVGITAALLLEVNDARASTRRCGTQTFATAAPLRLEARLTAAAGAHSQDMHDHGFMSHTGSDGSDVVRRVERQGYTWSALAENVAAGFTSPEDVVAAWLGSPGHCINIMNPAYTELGPGNAGVFWTLVFGRPR
ncbi:MAG: CAP domain-containing protein [Trueperaceae bacterium]